MSDLNLIKNIRPNGEYCDLLIKIEDEDIYCHKLIICKKSGLISMIVKYEQEKIGGWPPIDTISLKIPDNISVNDIIKSIHYLYRLNNVKKEFTIGLLNGLVYLSVDMDIIVNFIIEIVTEETTIFLTKEYVDLLSHLFNIYGVNIQKISIMTLLMYYYIDIKDEIKCLGSDFKTYFGSEDINFIKNITDKSTKFGNLDIDFPDKVITVRDFQWTHFNYNFDYNVKSTIKFQAFGIEWNLNRYSYRDMGGDYVDISVDDKCPNNDTRYVAHIMIRATYILFFMDRSPYKTTVYNEFIPNEYTPSYIKKNHIYNRLGVTWPETSINKLRFSLLMELME